MDVSTVKQATVQPSQAPKRTEPVHRAPEQKTAQHQEPQVKQASAPKPSPFVNAQGHTTGRLLHTTA